MRRLMAMGLVLLLVWMAFLPVQAQTAPTLSVSPTSGSGGTTITYHGTGYTPGGDVSVLFTGDGLLVDETQAAADGTINGSFVAPARERLTGESGNAIPVFAIDEATGTESARVTFTYTQPGQLPDTGAGPIPYAGIVGVVALLIVGGYALRRTTTAHR